MKTVKDSNIAKFTVPGLSKAPAKGVIEALEQRLAELIDLQLTLKHVHWNVVGANFIGVHEMLDPQVDAVREMTDDIAERIATLGGVPVGTPAAVATTRKSDDYALGRATVTEHLGALDYWYTEVNAAHRKAIDVVGDVDPVSEDMLIAQLGELEQFQWFVRAHLQSDVGDLPTTGTKGEVDAAKAAAS